MRGDSRLDFYAKSLALAGLGLIGSLGALIDYWPGPMRVPPVRAASIRRLEPVVQTLVDMRGLESELPVGLVASARAVARPEHVGVGETPERAITAAAPGEWPDRAHVPGSGPSHAVADLLSPSSSFGSALPRVKLAAYVESDLPDGLLDDGRPFSSSQPLASQASLDRSEEGFLSGMLKKTGSSVTSSLGKASNSVVGAVRAVGGAVKKAF